MTPTFLTFLKAVLRVTGSIFAPRNLPWHLLAVAATAATVNAGFDWWYFVNSREVPGFLYFPAVVMGAFLPIIVPVTLLVLGYRRRDEAIKRAGFAIGQAALVAGIVSSAYKALTGRTEPPLDGALIDNSHDFNFGFLQHGIFWGWPSGHTMTAFAMAVTVITILRQNTRLRVAVLIYALYIGLSVSISIHWFSDFLAGAIIGAVIGTATGALWSTPPSAGEREMPRKPRSTEPHRSARNAN